MNKKILASLMLFIICISSSSYALEYVIPVWLETGGTREVSNDALGENFLNIESESAILIEQTTRKGFI